VTKSPRNSERRAPKRKSPQSRIPEAFQMIGASPKNVPRLVLEGEWLKAVGFPVGSAAVLTTDRRGEMTLHRLGLGLPRRLRITKAHR
jgi:hypothetical protein